MATKRQSGTDVVSRDYQTALQNFWAARPRTAIEHLSKLLADEPEREDQFCLYRLWIEILADLGEVNTLRSLNEHLSKRSDAAPEQRSTYMSLRGLIYFEMDSIDAAALFCRGTQTFTKDPYCQELAFQLRQRLSGLTHNYTFLKSLNDTNDYFHLQTQARSLMINGDENGLKALMKRVEKLFPNSPLVLNFTLHRSFNTGDYAKAKDTALKLLEKYPGQTDFAIFGAYAAIKLGDNSLATELLERVVSIGADDDIDAAALLGSCYTDLYQQSLDDGFREKAAIFLDRATTMLEDHGFSAVIPSYHGNILSESQNGTAGDEGEKVMEEPAHLWLVKLSDSEFHEIRTKSENEINYLTRAIGGKAKPGDLVFFAGDDYRNHMQGMDKGKFWRIAAVYSVASAAKWHPFHGYENSLQLVSKPNASIPIDVHFLDSSAVMDPSQFEREDPRKYGVFELDYEALDLITESIKEHNVSEDGPGRILDEIERMRMSS